MPMTNPSTMLEPTGLREACTSARARIAQLVTISGMKMPSERSSAGNQALNMSSVHVTRLAMMRT